jgi:thioredoxin-dependent peroxiredoxin
VLGVSPDAETSHVKFKEKYGLPFTLLADTGHEVAEDYGVWVEKTNYGKTYWGVQRATFIIDPEGRIAHVIPKASPKTHDDEVLSVVGQATAT